MLQQIDIDAVHKELSRRSLAGYIRCAWRQIEAEEYLHNWHIDLLAERLEATRDGEITRLLINVPPGTMKSLLCNVFFPSWLWGAGGMPQARIISAAHEQGLAVRDSLKTRRLITGEWYNRLWGVELQSDQNEKLYYENTSGGFRQACPVRSMTGRRGHYVIWDDPHTVEGAHSAAEREQVMRIFCETLPTRLVDPKKSVIIVIMQRLHENDVSGHILANESGYHHVCLPMEYEPSTHTMGDARKEEGELLFPERFPRDVVERDKKTMGSYAVAGQFQQRPSPKGGGLFKTEWWQYYRELPEILYAVIFADTAQKTKEQNDYTVFQLWGVSKKNQLFLIDQVRGKWEAPQLLVQAKTFYNKHKSNFKIRSMKIEDKASGTGLIQQLKGEGFTVLAIPRNTDKITRAYDATPTIEAGHVFLPENAPWLSDYLKEFEAFPNGAHDDQIDPTMDAITELKNAKHRYIEALIG